MTIRGRVPAWAMDTLAILSFLLGTVYVLHDLWADPNGRYLTLNYQDSFTFEWFLTHATELFTKGESPFFSNDINYPSGVNLMANTSILTLALPLTPITLWLGAGVSFAIITTLAMAGNGVAWYWVLTRDFGRTRPAAFIGALFCCFAPAIISQSAGHPNIAGQGLIPLIVAAVFRMRNPGRIWRQGLVLAGLVLAQAGINEEMLFFTAMALFVFIVAYVPWRELPGYARTMLPKLGVTLLVAGAVLAYPLYFQFFGPQVYHGLDKGVRSINLDILGYTTFGRFSLAGDVAEAVRINRGNPAEENGFFGWVLCLLLVVCAIALWRSRLSRALFFTAGFFAVMSFGDVPRFNGIERTNYHGPWHWLAKLPLFDSVVPTRLGLIVTACTGVGLALAFDRLVVDRLAPVAAAAEASVAVPEPAEEPQLDPVPALVGSGSSDASDAEPAVTRSEPPPARPRGSGGTGGFDQAPPPRREPFPALVWFAAFIVALVSLIPSPQPVAPRPPLPALFTNGNWRTELPAHPVVAMLPGGWTDNIKLMRLSTETNFEVKFTAGYFLGPNDTEPDDKNAHFGPGIRESVALLNEANGQLTAPDVTAEDRANMRADLKYWKATNIVVAIAYHDNVDVLRKTIDKLVAPEVGPGRLVGGVWLWDVRPITGA
ncbi:hypothetical protein [Dactylosporangium sp. CA-139066]|uniref:hypothetical protein n=1 Tax=Dactylosporangium sp. CA-139066 TaxID=3239930 RepID=UPI003D8C65EE